MDQPSPIDLLEQLEQNGWALELPDHSSMNLSASDRQALVSTIGKTYTRWALEQITRTLPNRSDPFWDGSRDLVEFRSPTLLLLNQYETLRAWMNAEFTGTCEPSFVGEGGWYFPTYREYLENELIVEQIINILSAKVSLEEQPKLREQLTKLSSSGLADMAAGIVMTAESLRCSAAFDQYFKGVWEERERQKVITYEETLSDRAKEQVAQWFYNNFFPELPNYYMDHILWEKLYLGDKLRSVLLRADIRDVQAILVSPFPGTVSSRVKKEINAIFADISVRRAKEIAGRPFIWSDVYEEHELATADEKPSPRAIPSAHDVDGLADFQNRIEAYCYAVAKLFFMTASASIEIELNREDLVLRYGESEYAKSFFYEFIIEQLNQNKAGWLVIRSVITDELDSESQKPIKDVRGFVISLRPAHHRQQIVFQRLSRSDVENCYRQRQEEPSEEADENINYL